jgi:hypothetical protein
VTTQEINDVHRNFKYVCEVPDGWDAGLFLNPRTQRIDVIMVPRDGCARPRVMSEGADGVWREEVI